MTTRQYSSRSQQSTLTAAITSGATSMTVVSGTGILGGVTIPSGRTFTLVIDPDTALEEIVDATAVSTNTFTITRAVDGSSAQDHSAGAVVRHMAIGRDFRDANLHAEADASYNDGSGTAHTMHGIGAGEGVVVGTLKTQTLTNKTLTSPTISDPTITGTASAGAVLVFEGATADAYETTLTVVDPTQDNTVTIPNTTGTVVLDTATQTLTNKTLTSPVLSGTPVITGLSSAGMVSSSATPKDYVDSILGSATAAATSAASAATSAASAATSASSALTSANSASTSATAAATSATSAANSATSANNSANNASASSSSASASAASAATSATSAATSASSALTSANSASTSASSALTSANSAATSATAAASSAFIADTQSYAASVSASSAAASATAAATSASSAATSASSAAASAAAAAGYVVPSQTGNAGEMLITNGTTTNWSNNVIANTTATVGLIVSAHPSGGQTTDLQRWTGASTSTVLASVNQSGYFSVPLLADVANTGSYMFLNPSGTDNGSFKILTRSAANKGLVVMATGSQTANLQEWQDSSGTVLASITSAGHYVLGTGSRIFSKSGGAYLTSDGGVLNAFRLDTAAAGNVGLQIIGRASQTADLQQWSNSSGTTLASINAAGGLGVRRAASSTVGAIINTGASTNIGVIIDGAASQTGDLQQWRDSNANVLAYVNSAGQAQFGLVNVTSSTIAPNGIYLPAANTLGFATNSAVRLQISSTGNIGINRTASTSLGFVTAQPITGATTAGGISNRSIVQSDVTNIANGFETLIGTAAASFNLTALTHYAAQQGTFDTGSTVTTQYGFAASTNLIGATNNYGFFSAIPSAANRWNFYANGTAANYFAGQVSLGTTSLTMGSGSAAHSLGVFTNSTTNVGLVVRGTTSQVANLQEWQTVAGAVIGYIAPNGQVAINTSSTTMGGGNVAQQLGIFTNATTTVGLVVRGQASQTANLQQWQNSAGAVQSSISADGTSFTTTQVITEYLTDSASVTPYFRLTSNTIQVLNRNAGYVNLIVRGFASQTAQLQQWQNSAGSVLAYVASDGAAAFASLNTGAYLADNAGTRPYIDFTGTNKLVVNARVASYVGFIVQGAASQTADLQQWQNSSGTVVAEVTADGSLMASNQFVAGKNKVINGDFSIWQRGTSFTPGLGNFTADRFAMYTEGSGTTRTVSQQTFTAGTAPVAGYEGRYFFRYAQTVGPSANIGNNLIMHRVEGVRTLAGQTVTFSFWAKAASAMTLNTVYAYQVFGTGGTPSGNVQTDFATNISIGTSWARYSYTVTLPSISGKTIGTNNDDYIDFRFQLPLGSGATFTFDTWGWQVEAGSVATPFTTATGTLAGELAACQRYYWRSVGGSLYSQYGSGQASSTTNAYVQIQHPVTMRVAPTSVDYSTLGLSIVGVSTAAITALSLTTDGNGSQVSGLTATVASGLTSPNRYVLTSNNSTTAYIGFSAEL